MRDRFPAPIYDQTVLAVNFEDAKKYFLDFLLEIHKAHTLMLCRQGLMPRREAKVCLRTLDRLDRATLAKATREGSCEDLFFHVEMCLLEGCGAEVAGKTRIARSRNDFDITMYRMAARREILQLTSAVIELSGVLLGWAADHVRTLMPAYTHTQPAQPTTLAHYLMAAVEFLGRDVERLQAVFATVNRSPLGACAITTTGFPIDRAYTAQLLGFEGLQFNSYGAIAAVDYFTEAAGVVAVAMINLGRLVQDFLLWCSEEFGFLRLSDGYVQVSSIMPQKRNPVALEHTRILASKALGQAQAVLTCSHNTPFGDIVDSEDDVQPLVLSMFRDATRAVRLLTGLVAGAEARSQRLRQRVYNAPLTVTELADTLVRDEGLSFSLAHQLVSEAVKAAGPTYSHRRMVRALKRLAPKLIQRRLKTTEQQCLGALDPMRFVEVRKVDGGPAPSRMQDAMARARTEIKSSRTWLTRKQRLLQNYPNRIRRAIAALGK
jgi:argininosuccinate lyase